MSIDLLLWIIAGICFGIAALGFGEYGRVHIGWLGFVFVAIAMITT
jgi:hypothetical protein